MKITLYVAFEQRKLSMVGKKKRIDVKFHKFETIFKQILYHRQFWLTLYHTIQTFNDPEEEGL